MLYNNSVHPRQPAVPRWAVLFPKQAVLVPRQAEVISRQSALTPRELFLFPQAGRQATRANNPWGSSRLPSQDRVNTLEDLTLNGSLIYLANL